MMPAMAVRSRLALPLAAAGLVLAPAAAGAAAAPPAISLAPACYQSGGAGLLRGSGFAKSGTWTAKLGARRVGSGHTDAQGRIRARFTAPVYHGTTGTRELTLTVGDGRRSARTSLWMTPLSATFSPRTGPPATLRVRWRVLGLTPGRGVYVHYVRPDGVLRRTLRIGTAKPPCGTLKTGPIALFPFTFRYGTWTLQVDASPRYRTTTLPRLLIRFAIKRPPPPS